MKELEKHFFEFKKNIIGELDTQRKNLYGKEILYADWAASGRMYKPIEERIIEQYGPYYSNLHSEGNYISDVMSEEYEKSKKSIKKHFGASDDYFVLARGYGMTAVSVHLVEMFKNQGFEPDETVVIMSEYEHNSNFLVWKKMKFIIEILKNEENGQINLNDLEERLKRNCRKKIIVTISACSNVTGVLIDIRRVSEIVKKYNAILILDYTACAPYSFINLSKLNVDVLLFSVHKFIGGVSGPGIMIAKLELFKKEKPTYYGGGIVEWVNPWGDESYLSNIEQREEVGTVGIMQMIRARLCIDLKESMGKKQIIQREKELRANLINGMNKLDITLYDNRIEERLPIVSFNFNNCNYLEGVHMLNKKFGIQARGGCCCASIYGHEILNISKKDSEREIERLRRNKEKNSEYGWIRISLAPIVLDEEVNYIINAIDDISRG